MWKALGSQRSSADHWSGTDWTVSKIEQVPFYEKNNKIDNCLAWQFGGGEKDPLRGVKLGKISGWGQNCLKIYKESDLSVCNFRESSLRVSVYQWAKKAAGTNFLGKYPPFFFLGLSWILKLVGIAKKMSWLPFWAELLAFGYANIALLERLAT